MRDWADELTPEVMSKCRRVEIDDHPVGIWMTCDQFNNPPTIDEIIATSQ